jgi:hypothetical protein
MASAGVLGIATRILAVATITPSSCAWLILRQQDFSGYPFRWLRVIVGPEGVESGHILAPERNHGLYGAIHLR